ncbi:unnamed protein product [Calypogeia fissa]
MQGGPHQAGGSAEVELHSLTLTSHSRHGKFPGGYRPTEGMEGKTKSTAELRIRTEEGKKRKVTEVEDGGDAEAERERERKKERRKRKRVRCCCCCSFKQKLSGSGSSTTGERRSREIQNPDLPAGWKVRISQRRESSHFPNQSEDWPGGKKDPALAAAQIRAAEWPECVCMGWGKYASKLQPRREPRLVNVHAIHSTPATPNSK